MFNAGYIEESLITTAQYDYWRGQFAVLTHNDIRFVFLLAFFSNSAAELKEMFPG